MVREIADDAQFQTELTDAGTKLVVVDFFATWCGPCKNIAPVFEQYTAKYPNAVFLKVDTDKCADTAQAAGVSAMPTFNFYRNKTKIDSLRGADPNVLEERIKKWYGEEGGETGESVVKGHMDLSTMIMSNGCECLNESDDHVLAHALTSKGGYLESDCDEQLIISLSFNQGVKLHSLKITAPADKGPRNIKLFINQPQTLDFDAAESMSPIQAFELGPDDIGDNSLIPLRFVKFQNVQSLLIFVKDNQGNAETTQIDHLAVFGSPIIQTNMNEFKRVAGKKGESE